MNNQKHIVTHAGSFHADEVMAIALLEKFYFTSPLRVSVSDCRQEEESIINGDFQISEGIWSYDGIEDCRSPHMVVRTRDAKLLDMAKNNNNVFVIDVGGDYNKDMLNFDHHQSSMRDGWDDGTPFSSTGLIWMWLKENNYLSEYDNSILLEMEEKIIKPLDAHDNGLAQSSIAQILAGYNRSSDNPVEQNNQFRKALISMGDILENNLHTCLLKYEASVVLEKGWSEAKRRGESFVALKEAIAYHDCAGLLKQISKGEADLIIIPGQGNRYSVISMPLDTPFSIACPCPDEWRGKMGKTVSIQGRDTMIRFAHKTGFMCVVEGSLGDAKRVARYVIGRNKYKKSKRVDNKSFKISHHKRRGM